MLRNLNIPHTFERVALGSVLAVSVTQKGQGHRVAGLCLHPDGEIQQWVGEQIEERTIRVKLSSPGTFRFEVTALFFGEWELVQVSGQIETPDGAPVAARRDIELGGRQGDAHRACFVVHVRDF
jgi:hypothetical protein